MSDMFRAAAKDDYRTGRIYVYVASEANGHHVNWAPAEGQNHTLVATDIDPGMERDPAFILDEEVARPVYEALKRLFEPNTDNVTALRKDYNDERARVDKLINALIAPPTVTNNYTETRETFSG
jgi:hypothetical protein